MSIRQRKAAESASAARTEVRAHRNPADHARDAVPAAQAVQMKLKKISKYINTLGFGRAFLISRKMHNSVLT